MDDALFRPEVREGYRRLVAQGWTDALRTIHPDERIHTFWDYFRNAYSRNAGLRIDHVLLSPDLSALIRAAEWIETFVDGEESSDHAPTWVELDVDTPYGDPKRMRAAVSSGAAVRRLSFQNTRRNLQPGQFPRPK
jgi:exodeoxyribonuclease-3